MQDFTTYNYNFRLKDNTIRIREKGRAENPVFFCFHNIQNIHTGKAYKMIRSHRQRKIQNV